MWNQSLDFILTFIMGYKYISSLRSKRFRSSSSRKLGKEQKKDRNDEGGKGKVSSSPLPLPPFFNHFRSNFRAITRLETLATHAKTFPHYLVMEHHLKHLKDGGPEWQLCFLFIKEE